MTCVFIMFSCDSCCLYITLFVWQLWTVYYSYVVIMTAVLVTAEICLIWCSCYMWSVFVKWCSWQLWTVYFAKAMNCVYYHGFGTAVDCVLHCSHESCCLHGCDPMTAKVCLLLNFLWQLQSVPNVVLVTVFILYYFCVPVTALAFIISLFPWQL